MDILLSICEKINLRLSQNDEREINLKIREFHTKKNDNPLGFVPTSSSKYPHYGFISSLINK